MRKVISIPWINISSESGNKRPKALFSNQHDYLFIQQKIAQPTEYIGIEDIFDVYCANIIIYRKCPANEEIEKKRQKMLVTSN